MTVHFLNVTYYEAKLLSEIVHWDLPIIFAGGGGRGSSLKNNSYHCCSGLFISICQNKALEEIQGDPNVLSGTKLGGQWAAGKEHKFSPGV